MEIVIKKDCPVCKVNGIYEISQDDFVKAVKENYMMRFKCPVCGSEHFAKIGERHGLRYDKGASPGKCKLATFYCNDISEVVVPAGDYKKGDA